MFIPIHVDVPMSRVPWVNWGLMGVVVAASLWGWVDLRILGLLGGFEAGWNGGPIVIAEHHHWPQFVIALTSTFAHVDLAHLLGNMVFLWVFGNAIDAKLGHVRFLILYLVAGFVASIAHDLTSGGPAIGSSGAIFGVVGAFLVFYPRNDVTVLWLLWGVRGGTESLSSSWVILYWVGWNAVMVVSGVETGVAVAAHVGGFLVGFLAALWLAWAQHVKSDRHEQSLLDLLGSARGDEDN